MASNRREFLTSTAVAAALTGSAALLKPVAVAAADDSGPPLQHFANYDAPTDVKAIDIVNLRDLEGRAQKVIPAGDEVELVDRSLCLLKLSEGEERFAREAAWTTKTGKSPSKVPTQTTETTLDGK